MKFTKYKLLFSILAIFAVVLGAYAIDYYSGSISVSSSLQSANNETKTATDGTPLYIRPGQALTIYPSIVAANVGASNVVFSFNTSGDGTNYTTTYPIVFTNNANGTTTAIGMQQFPATNLLGVKYIRLDKVSTTQTNAITINALYYSYTY